MSIYVQNPYLNFVCALANNTKYTNWCKSIISTALYRYQTKKDAQQDIGYVEGHHILPRAFKLGGESDTNNIVYLSAREHTLIHWLYTKMFNGELKNKTYRAFHCMVIKTNGGQNKRENTKHHARARELASIANKERVGDLTGGFDKRHGNLAHLSRDEFKSELTRLTYVHNMSMVEIANQIGISAAAVHSWLKKFNIQRRQWLRDPTQLETLLKDYDVISLSETYSVSEQAIMYYINKYNLTYVRRHNPNVKWNRVCRVSDRKEMYVNHLLQWETRGTN